MPGGEKTNYNTPSNQNKVSSKNFPNREIHLYLCQSFILPEGTR